MCVFVCAICERVVRTVSASVCVHARVEHQSEITTGIDSFFKYVQHIRRCGEKKLVSGKAMNIHIVGSVKMANRQHCSLGESSDRNV